MTKESLGLSDSVYQVPMDADALVITARITVIWGQIERELDTILMTMLGTDPKSYKKEYGTRMAGSKIKAIRKLAKSLADQDHKNALTKMDEAVQLCIDDRNVMTHGLWGWFYRKKDGTYKIGASSTRRQRPFWLEDLPKLHESIIDAAIATDRAWYLIMMRTEQPPNRNRLQVFDLPFENGKPTVGPPPRQPQGW